MALKEYKDLTDNEVSRGELMSLRITLAVILHHLLDGVPNADAVYKQLESAIAQIVAQIPLQAIEPTRQQAFRDLVVERGSALLRQAKDLQHKDAGKAH
jgi:hypothetical protein